MSSIPEQIQTLEELAAADAELKTLNDELARERATLDALRGKLGELEVKLKADRAHLAAIDKLRNDYVGEVRTMMNQVELSRDKMNRARNEREANAAQRELEELRKLLRDREDEIGKLTTDGDASRQMIDNTDAEAKKIRAELGETEGAATTRLTEVDARRAERATSREVLAKKLPPIIYRRYDQVRVKRGSGLASTTDGTCRACHMALPPQLFHRLRREPLLDQCPSCNRIIYFTAVAPPVKEGS
ncbi:zinc ribbon domain-containing protein [soil metagenome]